MSELAPSCEHVPYGLLGRKLGHSWSPQIHQYLGSAPYGLFEREPNEIADFISHGEWHGLNVTIPYKRDAARLADITTSRIAATGAANTLMRLSDGRILADNTDVLGFSWLLERFAQRELGVSARDAFGGVKILVLGSGGAASAVCCALTSFVGSLPITVSRSGPVRYADIARDHNDVALIVNATPKGMYPHCPDSPITVDILTRLSRLKAIVDVIYNPERTGLCLYAEQLGIPYESGLAMLVSQAAFASKLWLGGAINAQTGLTICPTSSIQTDSIEIDYTLDPKLTEKLARIEHDLVLSTRNVILIGMPGVGKTSTGRMLARLVGRPFIDLDSAFTVEQGVTPATFIREHGEHAFRTLETQIAAEYGAKSSLVIACGGGIVTQPDNYELLRQNGTIVFLDRSLDELSDEDRPLSQSYGVYALARQRMPLYRSWANLHFACTGSATSDALALAEILGLTALERNAVQPLIRGTEHE